MQTSNLLADHLRNFMLGVQQLRNGKLSPYLLSPESLSNALTHVASVLRESFHQKLHFVHPTVDFYYRSARFAYARTPTHLLLTLHIPLTNVNESFDVYTLYQHDLIVHHNWSHVMKLPNIPAGIVVASSRQYYAEVTAAELQLILHSPHEHARVYRRVTRHVCVIAILDDDTMAINHTCHYQVVSKTPSPLVVHVDEHKYALTGIDSYNVTCAARAGVATRVMPGCESCMITIPPACSYFDGNYLVYADGPSQDIVLDQPGGMSRAFGPRHRLNLALLSKFYAGEHLRQIELYNFS
jgi:hypothetical protein